MDMNAHLDAEDTMASAGVAADVEAEVEDEDDVNEIVSASSGLQARLWNYLLDNLNRAVDEIYFMCEHESTARGCRQAITELRERMDDFERLMDRIRMQERFEERQLKSSIAWEVQTSPLHAPSYVESEWGQPAENAAQRRRRRPREHERLSSETSDLKRSSLSHWCSGGGAYVIRLGEDEEDERVASDSDDECQPDQHSQLSLSVDIPSDDEYDENVSIAPSSTSSISTISTASDNLLSLSARSSGGHRSLHSHKRSPSKLEKRLLTPERRKKSAEQTLREQIEKQERAERLRSLLLSEKQEKLREAANRAARVSAAQEERRLQRRLFMDELSERHEKAEQLHEAHVQAILSKAGKENQKVKEVAFINKMMQANRCLDLKEKLEDSELRRETLLERKRMTALDERQAAAQERRALMEAARTLKLKEKEKRRVETQRRRELQKEKAREKKDAKAEELARRAEESLTKEQLEIERLEVDLARRLDEVSRRKTAFLESVKGKAAEQSAKVEEVVRTNSGKGFAPERKVQDDVFHVVKKKGGRRRNKKAHASKDQLGLNSPREYSTTRPSDINEAMPSSSSIHVDSLNPNSEQLVGEQLVGEQLVGVCGLASHELVENDRAEVGQGSEQLSPTAVSGVLNSKERSTPSRDASTGATLSIQQHTISHSLAAKGTTAMSYSPGTVHEATELENGVMVIDADASCCRKAKNAKKGSVEIARNGPSRTAKKKLRKLRKMMCSAPLPAIGTAELSAASAAATIPKQSKKMQRLYRSLQQIQTAMVENDSKSMEQGISEIAKTFAIKGLHDLTASAASVAFDEPSWFCKLGGVSVLCDVGISARCRGGTAAFGILCALCNGNPEIQVGLYYSTHLNQGIGNIVFPWVVRLADEFAEALASTPSNVRASGHGSMNHKVAYISLLTCLLIATPRVRDEVSGNSDSTPVVPTKLRAVFVEYLVHSRAIQSLINFMFKVISGKEMSRGSNDPQLACVQCSFQLLEAISGFHTFEKPVYELAPDGVGSEISAAFTNAEVAGTLQIISSIEPLLGESPSMGDHDEKSQYGSISASVLAIAHAAVKCLNNLARLDLRRLQDSLSADMYCMNFLHITSSLLTQSAKAGNWELVDELLLFIGYFALENEANQAMLHWQKAAEGQESLGVLQILCTKMPFEYFGDFRFVRWTVSSRPTGSLTTFALPLPTHHCRKANVLLPTLIIACFMNESSRAVLQREISMEILIEYIDQHLSGSCLLGGSRVDYHYEFENRFPPRLRTAARDFFNEANVQSHQ